MAKESTGAKETILETSTASSLEGLGSNPGKMWEKKSLGF